MTDSIKLLLVFFFCLVAIQGSAQNKLLWYQGKKLNDTTLQLSNGTRITYSPTYGWIRTNGKSISSVIKSRLAKKEQFQKQVIQILTQGAAGRKNIQLANFAASTIDEVDKIVEKKFQGSDELTLESSPDDHTPNSKAVPVWVQNYFDEVVNYVIADKQKGEQLPDSPPESEFDYCYPCDKDRRAKYDRDTAAYIRKFFDAHAKMIARGFNVIRYFEHRRVKKLPYDSAAGERMSKKMQDDIHYLMNDLAKQIQQAWTLYNKNAKQLPFLVDLVLTAQRQFELFGTSPPAGFPNLNELGTVLITTMTKHLDEAVNRRDYPVLLNIQWLVGFLRQATLLFGEVPLTENLTRFLTGNRFEMIIDAEGEIGKDGNSIMARISGSNFYRAVPDENCKLRWHLYEPDVSQMKFKLEDASIKDGSYAGTKDWLSQPADVQLGFCEKPVRDTLTVMNFRPDGEEKWIIQGQTVSAPFIMSVFSSSFMDIKRIKAAAADKQLEARLKKEMMEEYQKGVAGKEALLSKDPATLTAEERKQLQQLVASSQNVQSKLMESAAAYNVLIKEEVRNNLKTVFEKIVDGKSLFPENKGIIKANFRVKIVHVEEE